MATLKCTTANTGYRISSNIVFLPTVTLPAHPHLRFTGLANVERWAWPAEKAQFGGYWPRPSGFSAKKPPELTFSGSTANMQPPVH